MAYLFKLLNFQIHIDIVSELVYIVYNDTVSVWINERMIGMKKNVGKLLALYPMPVTVTARWIITH